MPVHGSLAAAAPQLLPTSFSPSTVAYGQAGDAGSPNLTVNVSTSPSTICSSAWPTCPAGSTASRVTVRVAVPPIGSTVSANATSPATQVLFLLETTPYDGAYDPSAGDPGRDACAAGTSAPVCEESNLDHTFATYAGTIADAVVAAHPGTEVTFGLADYFATLTTFDDGDGYSYHVDVGNFTSPGSFPSAVNNSLLSSTHAVLSATGTMGDSDLSDNFLTSSSITALYGALFGDGINWTNGTQHVIVLLGSSAPRAPQYPENYCVSPSDYWGFYTGAGCYDATCEPSFTFATGASPACVGWVVPPTNSSGSIANDSVSAPGCTSSASANCTIDTIDVWTTPTDPYSKGWPAGVNATMVQGDATNILAAGCDLAAATGGSWDGPTFYTCGPLNRTGTLTFTNFTAAGALNLIRAIGNVSFGRVGTVYGAPLAGPMLELVLGPEVQLAADPAFSAACVSPNNASTSGCDATPTMSNTSAGLALGWNWSSNARFDHLLAGDIWTVAMTVVAAPGATGSIPVFRCPTFACAAAGAGGPNGTISSLSGVTIPSGTAWSVPVPLALLSVEPYPTLGLALATSTTLGEAPLAVTYVPTVSGGYLPGPVTVRFGDATQRSSNGAVEHTFTVPGTYDSSSYVTDSLGQLAWANATVVVLAPLTVSVTSDPSSGTDPLAVNLTAVGADGRAPYVFAWDLGDGQHATTATVTTVYTTGTWNATVTVTDALGYTAAVTTEVVVTALPAGGPGGGTPPPSGPGAGGGTPTAPASSAPPPALLWSALAVVASAGGVFLYRRRKGLTPKRGRP